MIKTYKCEIDCVNCANKIEDKIKKIDGINDAVINFMAGKCKLDIDENNDVNEILKEVKDTFKKVDDDCDIEIELVKDDGVNIKKEVGVERFLEIQNQPINNSLTYYDLSLQEIKEGFKRSHWIWFIFPQLEGLGLSYESEYYGIKDLSEARAYLNNEILRSRLIECFEEALKHSNIDPEEIFDVLDAIKVRSCATLFKQIEDEYGLDIFSKAIKEMYEGVEDELTLELLKENESDE